MLIKKLKGFNMKIQKIIGLVHIYIVLFHQDGHKAHMGETKACRKLLVRKPDRNIKTDLKVGFVRAWTAFNELTTGSSGGQL